LRFAASVEKIGAAPERQPQEQWEIVMRWVGFVLLAAVLAACTGYGPEVPLPNPPKVEMAGVKKSLYEADLTECDHLASEEVYKVGLFARHLRRTLALYQGQEGASDNPESTAGRRNFTADCLVKKGYRLSRS
jgi:hypothetical protein